jgi:hypothetical protein
MKVDKDGIVIRPSKKELSEEMKKLGYEDQGGNMFMSDNYIIEDLHSGNVCFSKEGRIMFIDPVIRVNLASEGYGGKRELGEIKLEKSEEQDIEKAESFKNEKTEDDIAVDKFFENKFEDKYKIFYEAVKKYLYDKWEVKSKKEFDDKFSKESKLKEVDIDDICPTQKYVSKKIIDEKMKNDHFKSSKIQLLKLDSNYYLFDGHHRTSVMIKEGYDTVKEEVLKLNKIKDFEKDIEKYLPEDYDLYDIVDKSVMSDLNKAQHKYIRKEFRNGKWEYIYEEEEKLVKDFDGNSTEDELCDFLNKNKGKIFSRGTGQFEVKYELVDAEIKEGGRINNTGIFLYAYELNSKNKHEEDYPEKFKVNFSDINNIKNTLNKSVTNTINKAFEDNIINETQYSILIEKAWKKQPVGTIVTHKDGKRYKKVSETGNMDQDWKLVSKDKTGMAEGESKRNSEAQRQEGVDNKPSKKELQESAKNTSETALTNAVKQSPDPEVRQTANEELKRRESEEKPKEEKSTKIENQNKEQKKESKFTSQFRNLSDAQVEFYLDAPNEEVKNSAKEVLEERGLRTVSQKEYEKEFEDLSDQDPYSTSNDLYEKYKNESKKIQDYLKDKPEIEDSVGKYVGSLYKAIRMFLTDKNEYKKSSYTYAEEKMSKIVNNISTLISDNKIDSNLTLYRSVKSSDFFVNLDKGDIYEDKSFSSTSLQKLKFGDFQIKILAKKGSNVANLDNKDEHEYLIDKNSKFRVVNKDEKGITVEIL